MLFKGCDCFIERKVEQRFWREPRKMKNIEYIECFSQILRCLDIR